MKPSLFSKLLGFEKIYLYDNLKESKKKYSKFIRKCISLALENNNLDCFSIFICKLKEFKGIRNIKITEEEMKRIERASETSVVAIVETSRLSYICIIG